MVYPLFLMSGWQLLDLAFFTLVSCLIPSSLLPLCSTKKKKKRGKHYYWGRRRREESKCNESLAGEDQLNFSVLILKMTAIVGVSFGATSSRISIVTPTLSSSSLFPPLTLVCNVLISMDFVSHPSVLS